MTARLSSLVPINVRGMWIGTFHGLCNRLLRAHHREAGPAADLPDPRFGRPAGDGQAPAEEPERRRREIPAARTAISSTPTRSRASGPRRPRFDDHTRKSAGSILRRVRGAVPTARASRLCRTAAALLELLQRNEPLRAHYQQRFRHILVDEFQDTNRLQYAWLQLLAGDDGGAPNGAGFRGRRRRPVDLPFRGAEVGNMREFERDYSATTSSAWSRTTVRIGNIPPPPMRHHQEQPRPSGQEPVDRRRRRRADPRLRSLVRSRRGAFCRREIRELVRDGVPPTQIAILYRSNAQSRVLEHEFFTAACRTRYVAGCASSSGRKSSMRSPTCACSRQPGRRHGLPARRQFPTRGIGARSWKTCRLPRTGPIPASTTRPLPFRQGRADGRRVHPVDRTLQPKRTALPLPEIIEHDRKVRSPALPAGEGRPGAAGKPRRNWINAAAVSCRRRRRGDVGPGEGGALASFRHASLESGRAPGRRARRRCS